jgi:hypothetical protein
VKLLGRQSIDLDFKLNARLSVIDRYGFRVLLRLENLRLEQPPRHRHSADISGGTTGMIIPLAL